MPTLAVRRLKLSHFRSYQGLSLEFDGGPVALFGANGAGKTNLLEAISLLSPGRGMRRARPGEMSRSPENIGWRITATLDSLGQSHEVITGADDPGASRRVEIDGKAASQVALGRIARILWLVPVMDRLWVEGASERRAFLDRIALSFDPRHAETVLAYEKAMRERNRLLRDQVREASWFTALEAQMARNGAEVIQARQAAVDRLATAQEAGLSQFPKADLKIDPGEYGDAADDVEGLAQALENGRSRDMAAGRTLTGPHRADLDATYAAKGMSARACSTGEQKALLVSLILANARALAEDFGAPPVLLLDEVAAHLDASRRAALYDEIVGLGAQAFMSGTGAELFEALKGRARFIEVVEQNGLSEIRGEQ